MADLLWLVPLFPLAGAVLNGLKRPGERMAGWVACGTAGASFMAAVVLASGVFGGAKLQSRPYEWFSFAGASFDFGLNLDPLSAVMVLVVTGVGFLIHVYSIGYMRGDPGVARYFAYLNLFMFAMTLLVLADNLVLMFVGWEGVGLCSYLLIGFWYRDTVRADAGKKAFIVNRVGDVGFLLGMFTLFSLYRTLTFEEMAAVPQAPGSLLTLGCLLLFVGATGKSAQIPLYVWLPDAMAGPTPVSALIHAATMVTAGVYMIARLHFVFVLSPLVLGIVAGVGALTALFAGILATAENNIKKVLAYSTISQLAFMFCGVAASDFRAGIFHLMTHAFFKALLFLGAGAVIHALHNEEDMRKMGGIRSKMPLAWACFLVGALAISGVPPLSGFWSKEAILAACFGKGTGFWVGIGAVLVLAAGITAFYMFRLFVLTFYGSYRGDPKTLDQAHAPPKSMAVPLWILIGLSIAGGGLPIGPLLEREFGNPPAHAGWPVLLASIAAAASGIGAGLLLYGPWAHRREKWAREKGRWAVTLAANKFYVDEIYNFLFVLPAQLTAFLLWLTIDRFVVDRILVHGWAWAATAGGGRLRNAQSGTVNASLAVFALGALLLLLLLAFRIV